MKVSINDCDYDVKEFTVTVHARRSTVQPFNPFGLSAREMMRRMLGRVNLDGSDAAPHKPWGTVMTHGVNRKAVAKRRAHRKAMKAQHQHEARLSGEALSAKRGRVFRAIDNTMCSPDDAAFELAVRRLRKHNQLLA